jgi:hypothetical protein
VPGSRIPAEVNEGIDLQWLQAYNPSRGCNCACHEGQKSTSCLSEARNPPNRCRKYMPGENARRLIHADRIHGSQEQANKSDCNGITDEGRDKPNAKLQPNVWRVVKMSFGREGLERIRSYPIQRIV